MLEGEGVYTQVAADIGKMQYMLDGDEHDSRRLDFERTHVDGARESPAFEEKQHVVARMIIVGELTLEVRDATKNNLVLIVGQHIVAVGIGDYGQGVGGHG